MTPGFRLVRRAFRDSEWERDGTVIWAVDTGLAIIMIQLEVVVRDSESESAGLQF